MASSFTITSPGGLWTDLSQVYRLKIALNDSKPRIFRTIHTYNTTLDVLHYVIQAAMGWECSHLHVFEIDKVRYSDGGVDGAEDEEHISLSKLGVGKKFEYIYDMGDSWAHTIHIEKVVPAKPGVKYPHCVNGNNACPPEDSGGISGYYMKLEILANPEHAEHVYFKKWMGPYTDATAFDVSEVNERLASIG